MLKYLLTLFYNSEVRSTYQTGGCCEQERLARMGGQGVDHTATSVVYAVKTKLATCLLANVAEPEPVGAGTFWSELV